MPVRSRYVTSVCCSSMKDLSLLTFPRSWPAVNLQSDFHLVAKRSKLRCCTQPYFTLVWQIKQTRQPGGFSPGARGTWCFTHQHALTSAAGTRALIQGIVCGCAVMSLSRLPFQQLVTACNDGARRMERTEQMYTIQKQMDFGKIKVTFWSFSTFLYLLLYYSTIQ